jgi:hypothetical protein
MIKIYGVFESCPAIFNTDEAWVFNLDHRKTWQDVSATESLMTSAYLMTKKEFDKRFGELPALPKEAFQTVSDAAQPASWRGSVWA